MAKVIKAVSNEVAEAVKMVEIKHTRVMKDASDKDVTVVDYVESRPVDEAIADAEARKASLEASLVDVEAELVEYQAIKDAE